MNQEILQFCDELQPSDWQKMATSTKTVKDVLAHLVGWQREVATEFEKSIRGQEPWFISVSNYDDFNDRIDKEFKTISAKDLLKEFRKWDDTLERRISELGEDMLRRRKEAEWVFDEGDDGHFLEHFNQIKRATNKRA